MIIELFGPPGSGKSTLSRAWRKDGVVAVRNLSRVELVGENAFFIAQHPITAARLLWLILRHVPRRLLYTVFMNAFVVQNAKYQRARRISRRGKIALIDQGHFQMLFSVFSDVPDDAKLLDAIHILPKPDLLLVLEVSSDVRAQRLAERKWSPREGFGKAEVRRLLHVSEVLSDKLPLLVSSCGIPIRIVSGHGIVPLSVVLTEHISYVTTARMPTEKAHGVSIAHMCAAFSRTGRHVHLIVPTRRTNVKEDLWAYYDVPRVFSFDRIKTLDFLGRGYKHPLFFIGQRLLYLFAVRKYPVAPGIVYTREPEIAWHFSSSHQVVFEAHNWPSGLWGSIQAFLLRKASLIVCNSEGTAVAARAAGLARVIVVPNGFSPEQFAHPEQAHIARERLGIKQDALVVLYVGALDARKGVQTLLETADLLPDATVAVIGGSEKECTELSRAYPTVCFLGYRPYREIAGHLQAADVLVLPNSSTSTESARFTSPIKMFAYMASGVPIVASDVPAIRAVLRPESATFVIPDDPVALARGIKSVLEDRSASAIRASLAREDAQAYTWDARAQKVLEALHAIIGV